MTPRAAPSAGPQRKRRSRRWLRLAVPYAVVGVLLTVTLTCYALAEPDPTDPDYLSPASGSEFGGRELYLRLRERGIGVDVMNRPADAVRAAAGGRATLFVPTPDLVHASTLSAMTASRTTVVMVRPGAGTLARGGSVGRVTGSRWTVGVAGPGCAFEPATRAGPAGVHRVSYRSPDAVDSCYRGSVLTVRSGLTLVGADEPFRNDRIDEYGNSELALGLLSGRGRVIWLDLHEEERPPPGDQAQPGQGDGGRGDGGRGNGGRGDGRGDSRGGRGQGGNGQGGNGQGGDGQGSADEPSMFDLFPPAAWVVIGLLIAAAVLAAAARARRIGPPVTEPLPVLVPAAETVIGRGRLYERSRDRAAALRILQRSARDRLIHLLDLPPDADRQTVVGLLAERTGTDADRVGTVLYGGGPDNDEELVTATAALDALVDAVAGKP